MTESRAPDPWDDDDFADDESAPDLGEPDDDEAYLDDTDGDSGDRPPTLGVSPEIVFWNGPDGDIEWEVRPVSAVVFDDDSLDDLAVERRSLLERYARGIARDVLRDRDDDEPIDLADDLAKIWRRLPEKVAKSTSEESPTSDDRMLAAWDALTPDGQTEAKLSEWEELRLSEKWDRLTPVERAERRPDAERLTPAEREDAVGLELRWGVYDSALSRDRNLLIELSPDVVVPLAFFTWRKDNQEKTIDRILAVLDGDPESLRDGYPNFTKADLKRRLNTTSSYPGKLLDWIVAVRMNPDIASRYRVMFRDDPARSDSLLDDFLRDLHHAEVQRYKMIGMDKPTLESRNALPVLKRVLVGGLE